MEDESALRGSDLLAHTGWMKALARSLVGEPSLAEDLVQDSLVTALEQPPRQAGALRAWLRTVVSRNASTSRLRRKRRERRERTVARPESIAHSPEDVVGRAELHQLIVAEVLALEEPYRSTILLRYFDSLGSEEIAVRHKVDATTVRWRLRRAIELLRKRLDGLHESRAIWCAALLTCFSLGRSADAMTVASGGALILRGAILMKSKIIAVAVLLSVLLVGFLALIVWQRDGDRAAGLVSREIPIPDISPTPLPSPAREEAPGTPSPSPDASSPTAPLFAAVITGVVSDLETGDPIAHATVRIRPSETRAVSDEDGVYRIENVPGGEHYLVASADGHAEEHAIASSDDQAELRKDFQLEPAVELLVTVTDREGKPLEGVRVTAAQPAGNYIHDEGYARMTDALGKATLSHIGRQRRQQVNAKKEGYAEVWTRDYQIVPESASSDLSIILEARPQGDAVVVGRVTGSSGEPLSGIEVQWIHGHGPEKGRVTAETARDGNYKLEFPRSQDWCTVSAHGAGYATAIREGVRPGNAAEPMRVDFSLKPGHWLEGQVADESGRAVEGARLVAMPTIWTLRNTPILSGNAREALTDKRGRFFLQDLAGPATALRIHGPEGKAWAHNIHPEMAVDQRVQLKLLEWGIIRGRVLDRETGAPVTVFAIKLKKGVGYYDYSRSEPGVNFDSPGGEFILKELDQGQVEMLVESEGYIAKWARDLSAVREDRASVNEIRITRGQFLEGTVMDAATLAPLAGARILFGAWEPGDLAWDDGAYRKAPDLQDLRTGSDGAFRVREGEPGTLLVLRAGYARRAITPVERGELVDAWGRLRVTLDPGASLSGVLLADGAPTKDGFLVLYRARPGSDGASREWIGNLERDGEGRFRVEDLAPGDYWIEHWRETPGKKTGGLSIQRAVRIEKGSETVLEFSADLGSLAFEGRLLNAKGAPVAKARLVLKAESPWAYSEMASSVDAGHDGRFHFLGLRPGSYRLEAISSDGARLELPPVKIETDLEQDLPTAFPR